MAARHYDERGREDFETSGRVTIPTRECHKFVIFNDLPIH
jgi:hypothetical protein